MEADQNFWTYIFEVLFFGGISEQVLISNFYHIFILSGGFLVY